MLMKCSKCNHEYDDALPACPLCGEPAPATGPGTQEPPSYTMTTVTESFATRPGGDPTGTRPNNSSSYSSETKTGSENPPIPPYPPRFNENAQNMRPPYAPQLPPEAPQGSGAAPMVLGILSLLLPFVGLVLAIIAIVMGNNQRKASPAGTVHHSLGHAGWVLGIVGLCFQAFLVVYLIVVMGFVMSMVGSVFDQIGSYSFPSNYGYYY